MARALKKSEEGRIGVRIFCIFLLRVEGGCRNVVDAHHGAHPGRS